MLIGGLGGHHSAGLVIDIGMTLARPVDAVGPVEAGVKPLRTVGGAILHGEHVALLVEECASVLLGAEVATLPAPVGPRAGHAIEHLARVRLPAKALLLGSAGKSPLVRRRTPQPGGEQGFFNALQA